MRTYRYLMQVAAENGEYGYPPKVMQKLGYKVERSEAIPPAKSWVFRLDKPIADARPPYLLPISDRYFD